MMSFYQDRLGTNIGTALKTEMRVLTVVSLVLSHRASASFSSSSGGGGRGTCSGEYIFKTAETSAIRVG